MHRIARLSVEARHAWALGYLSGLNNESETLRPLWQMDRTGRLGLDGQLKRASTPRARAETRRPAHANHALARLRDQAQKSRFHAVNPPPKQDRVVGLLAPSNRSAPTMPTRRLSIEPCAIRG